MEAEKNFYVAAWVQVGSETIRKQTDFFDLDNAMSFARWLVIEGIEPEEITVGDKRFPEPIPHNIKPID